VTVVVVMVLVVVVVVTVLAAAGAGLWEFQQPEEYSPTLLRLLLTPIHACVHTYIHSFIRTYTNTHACMHAGVGSFHNGVAARLLTLTHSAFGHLQRHNDMSPRAYEAGMSAY
jgi:hypothetical protein